MLILDGSRGLSVPEGVIDVIILVDEIEVDVEESTFEVLLVEVNFVDSVLETDEDVFTVVDEDVKLTAVDDLLLDDEDVELIFVDDLLDDDEDDDTVP